LVTNAAFCYNTEKFNFIEKDVFTVQSRFVFLQLSWFLVNGVTTFYQYMSVILVLTSSLSNHFNAILGFARTSVSVCQSVFLFVPYGHLTCKRKRSRKIKICMNVPQGRSNRCASFQLQRSRIKVTGCQKPPKIDVNDDITVQKIIKPCSRLSTARG